MADAPYHNILWLPSYATFLLQPWSWLPSQRTPGNEWISGPVTLSAFHDRGGGWGYRVGCDAVPGPTGYQFATDYYDTLEQAKTAAVKQMIMRAPMWLKALEAMTPANDNVLPNLDAELKAWLNRAASG